MGIGNGLSLIDRLNMWIEGVNNVQDEDIPLNGESLKSILAESAADLARLTEENEALRKDKERLDWLEMREVTVRALRRYGSGLHLIQVAPDLEETHSDLRAAIDAAIKEGS